MTVYDKRIECFDDRCNVINRKGLYAIAQGGKTKDFYQSLYDLYKEIYECNQEKTYTANIGYFIQIMGVRKKLLKDEGKMVSTSPCLQMVSNQNASKVLQSM